MHVLVTGHTGFKGAWATLLLKHRGYEVSGLALDPLPGSLFDRADLSGHLQHDYRIDVRDSAAVLAAMRECEPDVVWHMAAQPLVRASYEEPRWTMETNVLGTLSVLEAISATSSVRAAVIVTTDKVYRNVQREQGYAESDCLGGNDPYSASKAMADLLVSSWTASFPGCPIGTARAGNVIGGGDISVDRLMPDLMRGFEDGQEVLIRNPEAVRPWQHVLDCLNGYLLLMNSLLSEGESTAWNFGPDPDSFRTVREVADRASQNWGAGASWVSDELSHPHEEALLTLDSSKARSLLNWRDVLDFHDTIDWTVEWTRRVNQGESPLVVAREQIETFDERLNVDDGGSQR